MLARDGWPELVWAFDAADELYPAALSRFQRHAGFKENDLICDVSIDMDQLEKDYLTGGSLSSGYLNIETGEVAYLGWKNFGREVAADPRYVFFAPLLIAWEVRRRSSRREIQERITIWLDSNALRQTKRRDGKRLTDWAITHGDDIQSLVASVGTALPTVGHRAVLETFHGWTDVLLTNAWPSRDTSLGQVHNAAKAMATNRPDGVLILLHEWPGAPLIQNMSHSEIMSELRDTVEGFRRNGSGSRISAAASELGHWILDALEGKVSAARTTSTAGALLLALAEAAGSTTGAALAGCREVVQAHLRPREQMTTPPPLATPTFGAGAT